VGGGKKKKKSRKKPTGRTGISREKKVNADFGLQKKKKTQEKAKKGGKDGFMSKNCNNNAVWRKESCPATGGKET